VIGLWRKSATPGDELAVRSAELAARARRLELKARRLVDGRALGAYDSVFRGHGIEFSEVRAYQSGDPFSSIDWKVTARMGRPFVKRFVEERELTVLLIVDVSPSTEFGTRRRLKRELAYEVAGVLALAAARNNDRVGLLLFTDRVERFLPPTRGRGRVLCLLYELLRFRPEGKGTDLDAALDAANRYLKVRSLIFVISDFLGEKPEQALRAAAGRHDVVAIGRASARSRIWPMPACAAACTTWRRSSDRRRSAGSGGPGSTRSSFGPTPPTRPSWRPSSAHGRGRDADETRRARRRPSGEKADCRPRTSRPRHGRAGSELPRDLGGSGRGPRRRRPVPGHGPRGRTVSRRRDGDEPARSRGPAAGRARDD
jgi:hypothetical protein